MAGQNAREVGDRLLADKRSVASATAEKIHRRTASVRNSADAASMGTGYNEGYCCSIGKIKFLVKKLHGNCLTMLCLNSSETIAIKQ